MIHLCMLKGEKHIESTHLNVQLKKIAVYGVLLWEKLMIWKIVYWANEDSKGIEIRLSESRGGKRGMLPEKKYILEIK